MGFPTVGNTNGVLCGCIGAVVEKMTNYRMTKSERNSNEKFRRGEIRERSQNRGKIAVRDKFPWD